MNRFSTFFRKSGLLLVLFLSPLAKAQCVAGPSSITVKPGQSMTVSSHTLNLAGAYYYTISYTGTNLANNFLVIVNGFNISPNSLFSVNNAPLSFSFYLLPTAPVCASQTYSIKFFNYVGQQVCTFTYTINCKVDTKENLLVLSSGVYYTGDDYKIHRQYWNGSTWIYQAITPWGGWGSVAVDGWLAADYSSTQIFFKGTDGKLYNIFLSGSVWLLGPLNTLNNVKSDVQLRSDGIYYISTNNVINRTYWTGSGYGNEAIVPSGGWQGITPAGALCLATTASNVFFRATNGGMYNIYKIGATWYLNQLPSPINCAGDMVFDDAVGLFYKGTDGNVHKMSWNGSSWVFDAMTPVAGSGSVANHLTKFPGDNRVFYKGNDGRAYNIYKNASNQWQIDWLESGFTGLAGDLVAAEGKLFYISTAKQVGNYFWYGTGWWYGPLVANVANTIGCSVQYRLSSEETEVSSEPQATTATLADVVVFPNPTNGQFHATYDLNRSGAVTAALYNSTGQLVQQLLQDTQQSEGIQHLDVKLDGLAPGVYLLVMHSGVNARVTTRIVVE